MDGIYRISTSGEDYAITFNQFLIDDERPALIHTGPHTLYDPIRAAIAEVLDPARLEYVTLLHLESDECGGMDRFLAEAPESTLAGGVAAVEINLRGWNYGGELRGFSDGEVLDLGHHKLRFLETPHVHHWDSIMVFDETTRSVFPADLYLQPGEQPPVVTENLGSEMCGVYRRLGLFSHEDPVLAVVDRLEELEPSWVHAMHGGSLPAEAIPSYTHALRQEPFGFDGMLLGRELPQGSAPAPQPARA